MLPATFTRYYLLYIQQALLSPLLVPLRVVFTREMSVNLAFLMGIVSKHHLNVKHRASVYSFAFRLHLIRMWCFHLCLGLRCRQRRIEL